MMGSYFESIAPGRYRPTAHAGGAWTADEIHFSPLGGLVVHAIDLHRAATQGGANGKELGHISFDILGFFAAGDCEIRVETIRPGRTIELIEATVIIAGRPAVLARAEFIATTDTTAVAGGESVSLPSPDQSTPWSMTDIWPSGYVASLEMKTVAPPQPGKTSA